MKRRGFLTAILASAVAPAIVRVGSLMRLPARPIIVAPALVEVPATLLTTPLYGDLRKAAKDRLAQWLADTIDQAVYEAMAGDSGLLVPNHLQATNGEPILLPANNLRS